MKYITSLLLLTIIVHLTKCIQRPRYIECQDSNECPGDSCCVIGTGRYSIPTCKTYQDINEPCHPGQIQPLNTTVSYLDGAVVDYSNVFIQYCQCAVGLACENKTLTCQDPSTNPNFNFLD